MRNRIGENTRGYRFDIAAVDILLVPARVVSRVFGFGLVVEDIPVGKGAIWLIVAGFLLSFLFSNYGEPDKSRACQRHRYHIGIAGWVNVFSDIVSYIRSGPSGCGRGDLLTVNELVSPLLGNLC